MEEVDVEVMKADKVVELFYTMAIVRKYGEFYSRGEHSEKQIVYEGEGEIIVTEGIG